VLPPLTTEQSGVLAQITNVQSYLLHGRTGSGKTRLYQALAERAQNAGQSVLVLSPEIGLTSQLAEAFRVFGPARVVTLHSGLTNAQRSRVWQKIAAATEPLIVIGARSALFSPLRKLGLIIVDECHEPAYKQDQEPRYQANRVAAVLAKLHQATLIYGSATPGIVDYYLAQHHDAPLLELQELAVKNNVVTNTIVVDMRDRALFTRSPYLSDVLLKAIEASLQRREQSMLYLNRRGTARVSLCQNCGWQARCEHCDIPLTYHGDSHELLCHACGRSAPALSSCPVCKHTDLTYRGIGTKALVEEVQRLFPKARILRFDSDTTSEQSLQRHYRTISGGEVDILIGTQSLAKGFDFPLLSTLGVVVADSGLLLPDFTASERTYQLVSQVLGRVTRGHRATTAVVQTYAPESELLQTALARDWTGFYNRELMERRQFAFPPFYQLLVVRCRRASAASAEKTCQKIAAQLMQDFPAVLVDGPAPAFHERSSSGYTWQLVVKATDRGQLLNIVDALPSTVTSYDLDPLNLL
jgi:primosomal protein N' (replication factor Y)